MKRKVLKPTVQAAILTVTAIEMIFVFGINDMSLRSLPIYLLVMANMFMNMKILKKYGKGLIDGTQL